MKMNPNRLCAADVSAVALELSGLPEARVSVAASHVTAGYGGRGLNAYKFFWSPAARMSRVAPKDALKQEARLSVFFETNAAMSNQTAPTTLKVSTAPELPWQTVRGSARYAPLDPSFSSVHDASKLDVIITAETDARAARVAAFAVSADTPCDACGKKNLLLSLCGGCHASRYCSEVCQKGHWKNHKDACKAIKAKSKVKDEETVLAAVQSKVEADKKLAADAKAATKAAALAAKIAK